MGGGEVSCVAVCAEARRPPLTGGGEGRGGSSVSNNEDEEMSPTVFSAHFHPMCVCIFFNRTAQSLGCLCGAREPLGGGRCMGNRVSGDPLNAAGSRPPDTNSPNTRTCITITANSLPAPGNNTLAECAFTFSATPQETPCLRTAACDVGLEGRGKCAGSVTLVITIEQCRLSL